VVGQLRTKKEKLRRRKNLRIKKDDLRKGMHKAKIDLRERTKDFALSVVRMFSALPKTTEAQILGRQVLRSGTSIGANYREAYRGRSRPEFIAKCGDCLREIEETAYWLELLVRADVVPSHKLAALRQECDELTAIFVTIIKHSKAAPE
jgi:four helix bundle protein